MSPGESDGNPNLSAHPLSLILGAGAGDGRRRRGAHAEQPQRLSWPPSAKPPHRPTGLSQENQPLGTAPVVQGGARGAPFQELPETPPPLSRNHCAVVLPAGLRLLRFAAAGTGRGAPVWPTFPLSRPSLNGFMKSKRCFNHTFTLLEIMSLDS